MAVALLKFLVLYLGHDGNLAEGAFAPMNACLQSYDTTDQCENSPLGNGPRHTQCTHSPLHARARSSHCGVCTVRGTGNHFLINIVTQCHALGLGTGHTWNECFHAIGQRGTIEWWRPLTFTFYIPT
jgi:hypothetical protein